jgi:hypothetical protein
MLTDDIYGHIFIARDEDWPDRRKDFSVGKRDNWKDVKRSTVEVGKPILILLAATKPRIAGTAKIIEVPADAPPETRDQAWVEYTDVFGSQFSLPPSGKAPPRAEWDNAKLPLIFGTEAMVKGGRSRPFQGRSQTSQKVPESDAARIKQLYPGLIWGPF